MTYSQLFRLERPQRSGFILFLCMCLMSFAAAQVPDFTKGEPLVSSNKKLKFGDRAMGPTGLWGQVYSKKMEEGASRDARQFKVTKVESGSPAEGVIKIIEQWPVLEGRGKQLAEKLPGLKEEITNAPKVKLTSFRR